MMVNWDYSEQLQWIGQVDSTVENNLKRLIDSNPVIAGRVDRPVHPLLGDVRSWLLAKGMRFVADNLNDYFDDVAFQQLLMRELTEKLSKGHYLCGLRQWTDGELEGSIGEFYFPPSYLVCMWSVDQNRQKLYIEMHFIREAYFHHEFYAWGKPRRHPAVIVEKNGQLYGLIPISHSRLAGGVPIRIRKENGEPDPKDSYAYYRLFFKLNKSMLSVSNFAEGISITPERIRFLQGKLRENRIGL